MIFVALLLKEQRLFIASGLAPIPPPHPPTSPEQNILDAHLIEALAAFIY